jgi:hypothetical protein
MLPVFGCVPGESLLKYALTRGKSVRPSVKGKNNLANKRVKAYRLKNLYFGKHEYGKSRITPENERNDNTNQNG